MIDVNKIEPLSNKVICKTIPKEEVTTDAGLVLQLDDEADLHYAIVVAVGKGEYNIQGVFTPVTVKVGDKVVHTRYGGNFQRIGKEEYLICRENELIGIIRE